VQHGLEIVSDEVVKLRNYVKKIRNCPTRWNSTYLMINRQRKTMEYHQRLVRSTSSGAILDYPTNDDWNRLSDLCEVLKPIYIATTLLSNTNIHHLEMHKLQIYWNLIEKNTRICSILDPHLKLRLFFNNADISEVNNDVKELITEHISNANNNSHNNNQYPISHHVYFYNLFTTNSDNSNTNDQNNIDEYNNYLNLPSISDNIKKNYGMTSIDASMKAASDIYEKGVYKSRVIRKCSSYWLNHEQMAIK
ncbi:5012_t:CDS:2, partial [Entrophospora sp. SA101]